MRVAPINVLSNSQSNLRKVSCKPKPYNSNVNFQKGRECTKFLSAAFGALATAGAVGGTIIMTGGVAVPIVVAYGLLGTLCGAILGNKIDNDVNNNNGFNKTA